MKKHSVLLKENLCEGCTNCVKNCPTKAIRVHQGKATIKEELCIDCAECIRTCAYHAKYTETDQLSDLNKYDYPVVLVPPSFYGQFENTNPEKIAAGLYELGFKEVYDVAMAAEALTNRTNNFLSKNKGMFISSSCPVVVRMVKLLYPELVGHLMPLKSPVELMAEKARNQLVKEGIAAENIGIYFITPCPAKLTTVYNSPGMDKSFLDGAIAVDIIYKELIGKIDDIDVSGVDTNCVPYLGISWGQQGGETDILVKNIQKKTLSVSGIHNVKDLLEELSRNNIKGIKYFELTACDQGCVGGVLNVTNPYQAKYNIKKLSENIHKMVEQDYDLYNYNLQREFKSVKVGSLDNDFEKAMEKLTQLEKEIEILPGLDCAACGAPDCQTLAEDIVVGKAKRSDCIFVLRKQVADLSDRMARLAHALPPVMRDQAVSTGPDEPDSKKAEEEME